MIGQTLGGYTIINQIGIGGMATVYKAYDPNTERYVAIKILPEYYSKDPMFYERFRREARAIAGLEHIHILPVHAYGEENGIAYIVMRYLDTGTLADRVRRGPLPLREASRLLSQIASALDRAHAHDILHRDVKPSNILVDDDGNAYLTDFGIAKMVEGATPDLTGTGIIGTPQYMSPEQCMGEKNLTPASDVYSLGLVLYEMVTGKIPFQAETPLAVIHMQINNPLPPPRRLRPDLPEAAELVILKALAKDPEQRYQSCGALANAFAQAVSGVATVAASTEIHSGDAHPTYSSTGRVVPTQTDTRPAAPGRHVPIWALGVAGLGVVIIAGLLISVLGSQRPEAAPTQAALIVTATSLPASPTQLPATPTQAAAILPTTTPTFASTDTPIPPTPTPLPIIGLTSVQAQPTVAPTLGGALGPTPAPAGWLPVRFLYNADAFYWMNDSDRSIRSEDIVFLNTGSGKRFEGNRWAYWTMERGRCMALVFADVEGANCPEGRRPNAWFTPTRRQGLDFWTGSGQFRVLWRGVEIAVCDIAVGECSAYIPRE